MIDSHEKYRLKALACEAQARRATDSETRDAWNEIAIEWHALASRTHHEATSNSGSAGRNSVHTEWASKPNV